MKYLLIFNILQIFISVLLAQSIIKQSINPINGHEYVLVNYQVVWTEADRYATSQNYYLATITTQNENNFILDTFFTTLKNYTWIGANSVNSPDNSIFTWSGGPEIDMVLYDRTQSKCFGFCRFLVDEPDVNDQNYIYIWKDLKWDDLGDIISPDFILMEKGGEIDPLVIPTDMAPSIMTITRLNLNSFDSSKLRVTFTNSSVGRPDFNCTILTYTTGSVSCQTQYTVGEYDILISDGVKSFSSKRYHPNLPYIKSMIPGYVKDSIITINGGNFGESLEYVNDVRISILRVPCIPLEMLVSDRSITCRLTETIIPDVSKLNISTRYSLINMIVGGVEITDLSRVPVYDSNTNSLTIFTATNFDYFNSYYLAEGRPTYPYAPTSLEDIYFIRNLMYINTTYPSNHISTNYYFNSGSYNNSLILSTGGINTNIINGITYIDPQVSSSLGNIQTQLSVDPMYFSFNVSASHYVYVRLDLSDIGPPSFTKSKDFVIPTTGGYINVGVNNMILTSSNYTLLADGVKLDCRIVPYTENSSIGVFVGAGSGAKRNLTLILDGKPTGSTPLNTLAYYPPAITGIRQVRFNRTSGSVNIFGEQFGSDINKIQVNAGGSQSTLNTWLIPQESMIAYFNYDSLYLRISINVDGQLSSARGFTPKLINLLNATSIEKDIGGIVTIKGDGFANPVNVTIGGVNCTSLDLIDSQTITCFFDGSAPSPQLKAGLPVKVDCGFAYDTESIFFYIDNSACGTKPYCSGNGVCINGNCNCTSGYGGAICDKTVTIDNTTKPEIGNNTGSIGQFSVFFTHIREIDEIGSDVAIYPITLVQWNTTVNTTTVTTAIGSINNLTDFTINVTSIIFLEQTTLWFAGQPLTMEKNSFKYQIELSNYQFQNQLNSLQLIYEIQSPKEQSCSESSNSYNDATDIAWIEIQLGNKVFLTKFSNRMYIDNRTVESNTILLSTSDKAFLDPSFAVLVDNSAKEVVEESLDQEYYVSTDKKPSSSGMITDLLVNIGSGG
ncbi:hypothetical protein PPL_00664 [Heterostelium album PN500]|uniref:C-type lectin domain-containing protein n=1 Tax=Heterostelium pallidum (strain ATCC 26659 / Pp 5 / PN500) TaxID=670386 RepID=D3AX35_HETP5|nr:hypothetical protein PPL_00664 [Heterostelium album PN500]EFA86104.1 hypothetical protein PPL_00664 [Heterostelium album PN500]|eukprot:XP_020438210.1 hypothetical protein PPL_00664 [Heterostelium album PN500]